MGDSFVTVGLDEILVGEPLPASIYLYIDFRFITFRAEGDVVDRTTYDRLLFKKVKNLFVIESDRQKMKAWSAIIPPNTPPVTEENRSIRKARDEIHRKMLDIFQTQHPDKMVTQTLKLSKNLVTEVMKFPFATKSIAQLQLYARGSVDHSVNVSVLSVYLAMQMGYTHQLILQHVGTGALLHDIGKSKVDIEDEDSKEVIEKKMREHPVYSLRMLESQDKVPNEVKMIVAQHHENFDGTGYPKKLRNRQIYDLARIVSIANVFDALVSESAGTLIERQREAIRKLDEEHFKKFDPQKLEKALKILKLGI